MSVFASILLTFFAHPRSPPFIGLLGHVDREDLPSRCANFTIAMRQLRLCDAPITRSRRTKLSSRVALFEYVADVDIRDRQISDTDSHVFESHQLLERLEVASVLEDVDREAVAEDLRSHALCHTELRTVILEDLPDALPCASHIYKYVVFFAVLSSDDAVISIVDISRHSL